MLLLTLLSACIPHTYQVYVSTPQPDAHYILVRSGLGAGEYVYDCMSRPDGEKWRPTCVKAKMHSSPPSE